MKISVTIPATIANLGPGFDSIGMAVGLYNKLTLTAVSEPVYTVDIQGENAGDLPANQDNLVIRAAQHLFAAVGESVPGLALTQLNRIPICSGLGSSAAATVGGLTAANALLKNPLGLHELLQLATEIEGHPDNVAPALFGGLTLLTEQADGYHLEQIPTPPLSVVIVLPEIELPTARARAALPQQVPLQDAIYNLGHFGLLIRALETADYHKLAIAMADRLHQPYRSQFIPGIDAAFAAAKEAGAAGVAISGAGPSLLAFAPANHAQIGRTMQAQFAYLGIQSRQWILPIEPTGTQISTKKITRHKN